VTLPRLSVAFGASAIVLIGCETAASNKKDDGEPPDVVQAPGAEARLECPQRGATLANSDAYVRGLEKTGHDGLLKVKLLEASPPSPVTGNNAWKIQVTDLAGTPIRDAKFDWVRSPWMPCHEHGTSVTPAASAAGADGSYEIEPLYFLMPGIWTTTFNVTSAGGVKDSVTFQFYVPR
jgi:hypothetical protein